jgi:hypothetical protein
MFGLPVDTEISQAPHHDVRRWTRAWGALAVLVWLGPAVLLVGVVVQPEGVLLTAILWCVGLVPLVAIGHLVTTVAIAFEVAHQPWDLPGLPTMWWRWACVAVELLMSLGFLAVLLHLLAPHRFPVG